MSTITKEQAKDLRNAFECWQQDYEPAEDKEQYDMFGLGIVAMDALLASLEAEPVALRDERSGSGGICKQPGFNDLPHGTPLYTAPQVPTKSEPVAWLWSNRKHPSEVTLISPEDDEKAEAAQWSGWSYKELYAEPVTTAYKLPFEQWLSQQTGTIDVECGCVMTEVFFHWLRVAYEAGNSPVIPDGWVTCSERMPVDEEQVYLFTKGEVLKDAFYNAAENLFYWEYCAETVKASDVSHWMYMTLPAAPQQKG